MSKTNSAFSGFIDGYKAGNISSNASSSMFHVDEITNNLKQLEEHAFIDTLSGEYRRLIQESKNTLAKLNFTSSIDNNIDESIEALITYGNQLEKIIDFRIELDNINKTNFERILKKNIYHYLTIAKITKDIRVETIAINCAKKL